MNKSRAEIYREGMLRQLDMFEADQIGLNDLIGNLSQFLDELTGVTAEWKRAFRGPWGTLEELYSVALDRNESIADLSDDVLVIGAVSEMRQLVATIDESFVRD